MIINKNKKFFIFSFFFPYFDICQVFFHFTKLGLPTKKKKKKQSIAMNNSVPLFSIFFSCFLVQLKEICGFFLPFFGIPNSLFLAPFNRHSFSFIRPSPAFFVPSFSLCCEKRKAKKNFVFQKAASEIKFCCSGQ